MTFFPGIEIQQTQHRILLDNKNILGRKFNMEDCKLVSTPLSQNEKFNKEDRVEKIDEGSYINQDTIAI